jgi:hypothetical protein
MTALDIDRTARSARASVAGPSEAAGRSNVVVAIVDPNSQTQHLDVLLPRRWTARRFNSIYEVDQPDLLVLGDATPFLVAASRLLHSEAMILAVIHSDAPARLLVDLLHSGADSCVREGALHLVASHLIAGYRRRARR